MAQQHQLRRRNYKPARKHEGWIRCWNLGMAHGVQTLTKSINMACECECVDKGGTCIHLSTGGHIGLFQHKWLEASSGVSTDINTSLGSANVPSIGQKHIFLALQSLNSTLRSWRVDNMTSKLTYLVVFRAYLPGVVARICHSRNRILTLFFIVVSLVSTSQHESSKGVRSGKSRMIIFNIKPCEETATPDPLCHLQPRLKYRLDWTCHELRHHILGPTPDRPLATS
jgi:hypothetical protein